MRDDCFVDQQLHLFERDGYIGTAMEGRHVGAEGTLAAFDDYGVA